MTANIHTAMLLAAGLGTRMRPLTESCPKPLIKVAGKALIDYLIDSVAAAGIERLIVNVHYLPEQVENHLAGRTDVEVLISDERKQLLETGGALVKALPLIGNDPFLVVNTDAFWSGAADNPVTRLMQSYDPLTMDDLLLLALKSKSLGYDGAGDFHLKGDGRIIRRGKDPISDYAYAGVRITRPELFEKRAAEPFSANLIWAESLMAKRLYGEPLHAFWMHVGDPSARDAAERYLETGELPAA